MPLELHICIKEAKERRAQIKVIGTSKIEKIKIKKLVLRLNSFKAIL